MQGCTCPSHHRPSEPTILAGCTRAGELENRRNATCTSDAVRRRRTLAQPQRWEGTGLKPCPFPLRSYSWRVLCLGRCRAQVSSPTPVSWHQVALRTREQWPGHPLLALKWKGRACLPSRSTKQPAFGTPGLHATPPVPSSSLLYPEMQHTPADGTIVCYATAHRGTAAADQESMQSVLAGGRRAHEAGHHLHPAGSTTAILVPSPTTATGSACCQAMKVCRRCRAKLLNSALPHGRSPDQESVRPAWWEKGRAVPPASHQGFSAQLILALCFIRSSMRQRLPRGIVTAAYRRPGMPHSSQQGGRPGTHAASVVGGRRAQAPPASHHDWTHAILSRTGLS